MLFFQLKDSKEREIKYQKTIENLGKSLDIINDVKEDVEIIKEEIGRIRPVRNNDEQI